MNKIQRARRQEELKHLYEKPVFSMEKQHAAHPSKQTSTQGEVNIKKVVTSTLVLSLFVAGALVVIQVLLSYYL